MPRFFKASFALLGALSLAVIATASVAAQEGTAFEADSPKAEVTLKVVNAMAIHVGQWPEITIQIKNIGKVPFYITPSVEAIDFRGGFDVDVMLPPGARIVKTVKAVDYGPGDGKWDIMKEAQSFILLHPGATYGGTITSSVQPQSVGTYKLIARRIPPGFVGADKERLRAGLEFPVLVDPVQSNPVSLRVIK